MVSSRILRPRKIADSRSTPRDQGGLMWRHDCAGELPLSMRQSTHRVGINTISVGGSLRKIRRWPAPENAPKSKS
jgi:hypothetical protein